MPPVTLYDDIVEQMIHPTISRAHISLRCKDPLVARVLFGDNIVSLPLLFMLVHAVAARANGDDKQQSADDRHRLEKVVF